MQSNANALLTPDQTGGDAAQRVGSPGAALKIVRALAIAANLMIACALPGLMHDRRPLQRPAGMDDEIFEAAQRGAETAPLYDCCCTALVTLLVYPIVIV